MHHDSTKFRKHYIRGKSMNPQVTRRRASKNIKVELTAKFPEPPPDVVLTCLLLTGNCYKMYSGLMFFLGCQHFTTASLSAYVYTIEKMHSLFTLRKLALHRLSVESEVFLDWIDYAGCTFLYSSNIWYEESRVKCEMRHWISGVKDTI